MDVVKFGLLVFAITLGIVLIKLGLDLVDKLVNKKRNEMLELGVKLPLWLDILEGLTGAARVAVNAVEQTTVKRYKEAKLGGGKLTPEEQKEAWREAVMLMLADMPQYLLDFVIEHFGTDKEAQIEGLRKYIEAAVGETKKP